MNVSDDDEDIDEVKENLEEHKENWKGGKFGQTDAGNCDGSGGEMGENLDTGKPHVTPGKGGN